ncbi:MAG: hypothetical protein AAF267_20125 [Deinococcota bacterium]
MQRHHIIEFVCAILLATTSIAQLAQAQTDLADMLPNTRVSTAVGQVQLQDGEYTGTREGQEIEVSLLEYLSSDLDSDGDNDAVALVRSSSGGSGVFFELVAFIEQRGVPQQVTSRFIGDRTRIDEFNVLDGTVVLNLIRHDDDDPLCCPSMRAVERYRLSEGTWLQVADDAVFVQALQQAKYQANALDGASLPRVVQLVNGRYGETSERGRLELTLSRYALADLDRDGDQDAAVLLSSQIGTQQVTTLTVMRNESASAQYVASRDLEITDNVQRLYIESDFIHIDVLTLGETDPPCCSRTRITQRYALDGDTLIFVDEVPAAEPLNFDEQAVGN